MTTKHFVKIAAIIKDMPDHAASLRYCKESAATAFANALEKDYPRFKKALFLKACGMPQS